MHEARYQCEISFESILSSFDTTHRLNQSRHKAEQFNKSTVFQFKQLAKFYLQFFCKISKKHAKFNPCK